MHTLEIKPKALSILSTVPLLAIPLATEKGAINIESGRQKTTSGEI